MFTVFELTEQNDNLVISPSNVVGVRTRRLWRFCVTGGVCRPGGGDHAGSHDQPRQPVPPAAESRWGVAGQPRSGFGYASDPSVSSTGDSVVLCVNNLGALSCLEMAVVTRAAIGCLGEPADQQRWCGGFYLRRVWWRSVFDREPRSAGRPGDVRVLYDITGDGGGVSESDEGRRRAAAAVWWVQRQEKDMKNTWKNGLIYGTTIISFVFQSNFLELKK